MNANVDPMFVFVAIDFTLKNLLGSVSISTIVGLVRQVPYQRLLASSLGSVTFMPKPPECSAKSAKL